MKQKLFILAMGLFLFGCSKPGVEVVISAERFAPIEKRVESGLVCL